MRQRPLKRSKTVRTAFATAAVLAAGLAFSCADGVQIPISQRKGPKISKYENAKALGGGDVVYFKQGKHELREGDELFAVKPLTTERIVIFRITNVGAKGFNAGKLRINFGETKVLGYPVLGVGAIMTVRSEPGSLPGTVRVDMSALDGPAYKMIK